MYNKKEVFLKAAKIMDLFRNCEITPEEAAKEVYEIFKMHKLTYVEKQEFIDMLPDLLKELKN